MEDLYLYQKIAESIRQEILRGKLQPGDHLPTVREMASRWNCTIGTVQRAYRELARQGLALGRAGQGTRVIEPFPEQDDTPLRRASLIHRAETFLLEVLTAGYTPGEVEEAVRQALDRWRVIKQETTVSPKQILRYAGSHDLVLTWLASHFSEIAPGYELQLKFTGSLGGLIALAQDEADLAGCHLWDEDSRSYNLPYVKRLLPNRRVALINLAQRRLGLILPVGNPAGIQSLDDLNRPGLRFTNRQPGSGTRVWLDAHLRVTNIDPANIVGYTNEKMTHSEVAQEVAEGEANLGIGLEAAALGYGLDFIFLTNERYDLVIPAENLHLPAIESLTAWLRDEGGRGLIESMGGYDASRTGETTWIG